MALSQYLVHLLAQRSTTGYQVQSSSETTTEPAKRRASPVSWRASWRGSDFRLLETHPLRGPLVETWVLGEIAKAHLHRGRRPRMFFYREQNRLEIDVVLEKGADLTVIEIKSARTPSGRHFVAFDRLAKTLEGRDAPRISDRIVVYGGDQAQARSAGNLLSWRDLDDQDWLGRTPS